MIAGVILVLGLVLPNGKIVGDVVQMPSMQICMKAHTAFLKAPEIVDEDAPKPANRRTAACLFVPVVGSDT